MRGSSSFEGKKINVLENLVQMQSTFRDAMKCWEEAAVGGDLNQVCISESWVWTPLAAPRIKVRQLIHRSKNNLFKVLHIPSLRRSHTFSLPVSNAVLTYCTASNSHNPAIWLVNVVSESKNGIIRNGIFNGEKKHNDTPSPCYAIVLAIYVYVYK